jgi:hypothetical protein
LKQNTQIFLIIVFTIVGVFILIYTVLSLTVGEASVGSTGSRLKMALAEMLKVPIYVVVAALCTFIGLIVGIFVGWNGTNTVTTAPVVVAPVTSPGPSGSPSGSPSGPSGSPSS